MRLPVESLGFAALIANLRHCAVCFLAYRCALPAS
jgi:hypothetical protein